jgi:transaldolase / glucose-6-phosphate isomerase
MFPEYEAKLREIVKNSRMVTVLGFAVHVSFTVLDRLTKAAPIRVFLQITCDESKDLRVPEKKYTFGIVKAAQARGDFQVLTERYRRALRIHLGSDLLKSLDKL